MGRIRSIKPEFPQSESIGRLSRDGRLLFIQLWTIVDDEGRARGSSRMLASLLYPYDLDAPSLIEGWLTELESQSHIRRYTVGGSTYLEVVNFNEHQKIDKPSKSKLPSLAKVIEDSPKASEESATDKEGDQDKEEDQEGDLGGAEMPRLEPPPLDAPLLADSPGRFPEGLSEIQYASGILERRQIVDTFRVRDALGKAIVLLGKAENREKHVAAEAMESRIIAAQSRGDTINSFWFEDSKWKGEKVNGAGIARENRAQQRSDSTDEAARAALRNIRERHRASAAPGGGETGGSEFDNLRGLRLATGSLPH